MDRWANFYVIVGSAGAALISVQFVVVTAALALLLAGTGGGDVADKT